jgi:PHD/YefM family antitoxin component YafN of YafNO toxin-antitoxin module
MQAQYLAPWRNFVLDMPRFNAYNPGCCSALLAECNGKRLQGDCVSICIPNSYVNPNVRTVGVSKLRSLNASQLRGIDKTLVIQENDQPLAVLLKYEEFLAMQKQLMAVLETQAVLSDKNAVDSIMTGRTDVRTDNTRTIDDVRNTIKKAKEKA